MCQSVWVYKNCVSVSVYTVVQNRDALNSLALQADTQKNGELSSPSVLSCLARWQMTNLQQLNGP